MYEISTFRFDWDVVCRRLVGPQFVSEIQQEGSSEQNKKDRVLEKWLEVKGSNATYRELINVFEKLKCHEAAHAVRGLVTPSDESENKGKSV